MSLLTKFLKLILPSGTDYYNIDDFNKNFTALDEFAESTKQSISDLDVADIKQSIMADEDGKPLSLEAFLRSQNENLLTKAGLAEDQIIRGKNAFLQNITVPLLPADEAHAVSKYYLDEGRAQERMWKDFIFSGGAKSGRIPFQYSNSGGIAVVSGDIIFPASSSAAIGVLPVEYRPSVIVAGFAVVDSWYGALNSVIQIQINPQGIVTRMEPIVGTLSNSVGYLFYLSFPAEQ